MYSTESLQPESPVTVLLVKMWRMLGEYPKESPKGLKLSVATNSVVVLRPMRSVPHSLLLKPPLAARAQ